jgi:hypothetical protein
MVVLTVTPHDRGYGFRGGLWDFSPPAIEEVRGGGRRQCGGAARAPPQPWAAGGRLVGPEGQDVEERHRWRSQRTMRTTRAVEDGGARGDNCAWRRMEGLQWRRTERLHDRLITR